MENLPYIGQMVLGAYFVMNGAMHFMKMDMVTQYAQSKGLPAPKIVTGATGALLVLAGLGIVMEKYLYESMGALVIFLVVVAVVMHNFWKDKNEQEKMHNMHYFMNAIAMAAALLWLMGSKGLL
jgi:putative oxidoreductase